MMDWFRGDGLPTAAEWQAVWAFTTAAIALVAAVIALSQYRTAVRNQIEQARPVVVVDLRFLGALYACVEVTNVGRTAAHDISFEWSEKPIAIDELSQGAIDRALVDGRVPFLAPGRTITYMLNKYNDDDDEEQLPRRFEVTARYRGSGTEWDSVSVLDVDQWAETMIERDPFESITTELKKLADAARNQKDAEMYLARAADSLNVYLEAGPRVQMARQKVRDDRAARRRALEEQQARLRAAQSAAAEEPAD